MSNFFKHFNCWYQKMFNYLLNVSKKKNYAMVFTEHCRYTNSSREIFEFMYKNISYDFFLIVYKSKIYFQGEEYIHLHKWQTSKMCQSEWLIEELLHFAICGSVSHPPLSRSVFLLCILWASEESYWRCQSVMFGRLRMQNNYWPLHDRCNLWSLVCEKWWNWLGMVFRHIFIYKILEMVFPCIFIDKIL